MAQQKYASMATEDLKESSGLWDNADAVVTNVQFTREAPENYQAEGNPIFVNVSFLLDGEGEESDRKASQSYSCGPKAGDNFTVGEDGFGLIPSNDDAAIQKNSKWGTFISALETAGFPKAILQAGDLSKVIGLHAHFKRVADAERNFGEDARTRPGQKKSKFPPSTLVVTKILALPGEKKGTAAAGKAAAPAAAGNSATTKAPAGPANGEDFDAQVAGILMEALGARDTKSAQRSQLTLIMSKAAMALPDRIGTVAEIAKRATNEEFLAKLAESGVISYDPAAKPQVVTLAA